MTGDTYELILFSLKLLLFRDIQIKCQDGAGRFIQQHFPHEYVNSRPVLSDLFLLKWRSHPLLKYLNICFITYLLVFRGSHFLPVYFSVYEFSSGVSDHFQE